MHVRNSLAILCCAAFLSCRQQPIEPLKGVYLYAPAVHQGRIAAFVIDQKTGVLNPVTQKSLYAGADTCREAVVHPSGRYLYINCLDAIAPFRVNADGSLKPMRPTEYEPGMDLNRRFAMHPSGRFLYLSGPDSIRLFRIDAREGTLDKSSVTFGAPNTHDMFISPDGKFLYAADRDNRSLRKYVVDPSSGSLAYEAGTSIGLRDGTATDMAFDPSGRFAYVLHAERLSTLMAYRFSKLNGELDYITSVSTGSDSGSVAIDPQGQYLFVSDSTLPQVGISSFRIDSDGTLTENRDSPFSTKYSPVGLLVDPSGNYLYAVTKSFDLYGFQINRSSGSLVPLPAFHASIYGETYAIACTPQVGEAPTPAFAAATTPEAPKRKVRFVPAPAGALPVDRMRDPDVYTRVVAIQDMQRNPAAYHDAIPNLIDALDDPNENVVFAASTTLGMMGPEFASQTVPALLKVTAEDRPLPQREIAGQALHKIDGGNPVVIAALEKVESDRLHGVTQPRRRSEPLEPLEPSGNVSVDALVDRLTNGSYYDRKSATAALVAMGPRAASASERLGELLFHKDRYVRRGALQVLASMGRSASPAIPYLYGALQEGDLSRNAAIIILRIRHGDQIPTSIPESP